MNQFEHLLPLVYEWVEAQEKIILAKGVALSTDQKIDAHLIGVEGIDKVRLLKVDKIPSPDNPLLLKAGEEVGLLSWGTIGISFRYGIYIHKNHWDKRELIAHELVHTMQYEKLGSIPAFLKQYLSECITLGYANSPLEKEAETLAHKICN